MNITFMIGNGFDIKFGLKTSYNNFYSHINIKHPELDNIFFNRIKKNTELWEDFEKMMGLLTCYSDNEDDLLNSILSTSYGLTPNESKEIAKNIWENRTDRKVTKVNFFEDLKFFFNEFKYYLDSEELIFNEQLNSYSMNNSLFGLVDFFKDFDESEQNVFFENLNSCISNTVKSNFSNNTNVPFKLNFNFLNFNYTSTLKKLLNKIDLMELENSWKNIIKNELEIDIDVKITFQEFHVHANKSSGMFFGVDSERQLNLSFFDEIDEVDMVVKPYKIEAYGSGNFGKYSKVLVESDYVYIYGMSLGVTDRTWWDLLINLIDEYSTTIVIHYFETNFIIDRGEFEFLQNKDKVINLLLKYDNGHKRSSNRTERRNKKNRIIPIANSKRIFQTI